MPFLPPLPSPPLFFEGLGLLPPKLRVTGAPKNERTAGRTKPPPWTHGSPQRPSDARIREFREVREVGGPAERIRERVGAAMSEIIAGESF